MPGKLVASLLLALALVGAFDAARHVRNDLAFAQLEAELTFWGAERYQPTPATRTSTAQGIAQLLNSAPHNPNYWTLRAAQQAWEAWWADDEATKAHYNTAALQAQQQALHHRPAHGQSQQLMLEYAQRAKTP